MFLNPTAIAELRQKKLGTVISRELATSATIGSLNFLAAPMSLAFDLLVAWWRHFHHLYVTSLLKIDKAFSTFQGRAFLNFSR
jgi:hypothetical protein